MGVTNMDNQDILSKLSFWNKLTDREKETAARGSATKTYDKGTYIYGFADACLGFVYVKQGSIRVLVFVVSTIILSLFFTVYTAIF